METFTNSSRILLNISGTKYEATRKSLLTHPSSRLGKLVSASQNTKQEELYFNRPSMAFESILVFYQTGKLHLPPNVCPNVFKEELEYWEIDHELMEQCCLMNYIQFLESYKTKAEFKNSIIQSDKGTSKPCSSQNRIWRIIDYKERTWLAKLFLFVGIGFVLLSVITLALSSLPEYRRTLTACEWHEYVSSDHDMDVEVKKYFGKYDCKMLKLITSGSDFYFDIVDDDDHKGHFYEDEHFNERNPEISTTFENFTIQGLQDGTDINEGGRRETTLKTTLPDVTLKNNIFYQIDYLATAFFTVELLLRLCVCPSLKLYFTNFLNAVECIVLFGTYVDIIMFNIKSIYKFSSILTNIIDFIKFLRVIRLLRYCQHLAAVQVLKFSIRKNAKDLLVLFFHIVIILLLFANIIFLVEERDNINSIPQGWWLGLVTLTTVGYGDLTPKSFLGKIACSLCALCGIIMMSLIIPIFVETFVQLYGIAHIGNGSNKKVGKTQSMMLTNFKKIGIKTENTSGKIEY